MHKTDNMQIKEKNWKDFNDACKNKKLILYGIGPLMIYLSLRADKNISIADVIDNDINKQGRFLNDFFDISDFENSVCIKISSKDILKNYKPDEVVILIASHRFYENIASELDEMHFHCYFSVLNLEYNYREEMKKLNSSFETEKSYIKNYVRECIKKYPVQSNKLIFSLGAYIEHGKYITEQLLRMEKKLDIVWVINNPNLNIPKGVRAVLESNLKKYVYEMETAKVWVYSSVINPAILEKRTNQIYIQTKHWGSITLKTFALANPKVVDTEEVKMSGKWIDYIISGSEFDEETCRKGYGYNGKFLRFGSSRSDILFQPKKCKEKIFNKFNLNSNDHVLIYAPTYRIHSREKYYLDFKWQDLNFDMLSNALKDRWGGEWKIFLRLHPFIKINSEKVKKPDYVIDVSNYEDSQELVAASDIMISDYSSIMFEPAYVMKPVFLYSPDKDAYETDDQEFFLKYDTLPFPISTTNEELSSQIRNFDEDKYLKNLKSFFEKYGVNEDGHASERAAKFILDLVSSQED